MFGTQSTWTLSHHASPEPRQDLGLLAHREASGRLLHGRALWTTSLKPLATKQRYFQARLETNLARCTQSVDISNICRGWSLMAESVIYFEWRYIIICYS